MRYSSVASSVDASIAQGKLPPMGYMFTFYSKEIDAYGMPKTFAVYLVLPVPDYDNFWVSTITDSANMAGVPVRASLKLITEALDEKHQGLQKRVTNL